MLRCDYTTDLRYVNLFGIFMSSLIGDKYNPNNIGLCRYDRFAVSKNTSGLQFVKIKKTFQEQRFRYYYKLQHGNK